MILQNLTNEKFIKKFKNQFDLVNYAIKLAENMIQSGRAPRVQTDIQNRAVQALEEIATGKDYFELVVEKKQENPYLLMDKVKIDINEHDDDEEDEEEEDFQAKTKRKKSLRESGKKGSQKKHRQILED